jgi:hypothetical protein
VLLIGKQELLRRLSALADCCTAAEDENEFVKIESLHSLSCFNLGIECLKPCLP